MGVETDDDVVMVLKARWARALGLEDETMSIVDLEKATRRQRQAMEDAMAADLKHTNALRRRKARGGAARATRSQSLASTADRLQQAALAFASTINTPDPICGVEPALSHLEAAARAFAAPLPSGAAAALRQAVMDAVQAGEWHHSDPNNPIDAAVVALQYEMMEAGSPPSAP